MLAKHNVLLKIGNRECRDWISLGAEVIDNPCLGGKVTLQVSPIRAGCYIEVKPHFVFHDDHSAYCIHYLRRHCLKIVRLDRVFCDLLPIDEYV